MAELRIDGVTKRFGSFTAVDRVELTIPDQEFMVLLGPSGCGKSTLLRSIAGLEQVSEGRVVIGGRDVTHVSPKDRRISMVFQSYAVFPHMTVFDNIAFGLRRQKKPKDVIQHRVEKAAELLHITELLHRYPNSLSGGQRQRVAIGRALYRRSSVLVFDEGTSALDSATEVNLMDAIERLRGDHTIILIAHRLATVRKCDRVVFVERGRIAGVDTFDALEQENERFRRLALLS